MRELYLLRHGETAKDGGITERSKSDAITLGKDLPKFTHVISSDATRAIETALAVSGKNPEIDERAGFYAPAEIKSPEIYQYGISNGINFFDAAELYDYKKLAEGVKDYAKGLIDLVKTVLEQMQDNQCSLIVSHDLTITTAMSVMGFPRVSTEYLKGYRIDGSGVITKY